MLQPAYRWCTLEATEDGKIIFKVTNIDNAPKTKIWIDGMFFNTFQELPHRNESELIQGHEYFEMYSPKTENANYTQTKSFFADILNLKSFRIYSTIPTEAFWLYDQAQGTMVKSDLLTEIVYNTKEMTGNTNLLYIPSVFRRSSMTDAGEIASFRLWITAYYFNGREVHLTMDRNAYVSITLVFERKEKI